ncbi:crossover junction endodeoxyribonuclease RuvC [Candidatus Bipolaricaulota bacterium]|nr:crossover junction endodeoxyribonuclease RuvC [Candidatus Bipolaricaulota bacterium]TFH10839.1 MAG: crossover junction endodeoxyribonuclease RuvC [Candidatus Atribacteria bacterium]
MKREVVAIGFDPGLAITGYGVVRMIDGKWQALAGGVIRTDKDMPRAQRLRLLHDEAQSLIETYKPIGVGIEEVFFATNARTAIRTAEARGVLLMASDGVCIRGYTPLQVKKRVAGYGKAPKSQVQAMVKRLLNLAETPKPDDMADGLALALCYLLEEGGVSPRDHAYL